MSDYLMRQSAETKCNLLAYTVVFPGGERIYFTRNPFKPLTQKRSREIVGEFGGNIRDYLINVIEKKLGERDYGDGRQVVTVFEKFESAFDRDNTTASIYKLVFKYTAKGWEHVDTEYEYKWKKTGCSP